MCCSIWHDKADSMGVWGNSTLWQQQRKTLQYTVSLWGKTFINKHTGWLWRMTFGAHAHTHKGMVPMATGASCPRRPEGGRGKTERGGGRGSLGELRRQAEVRVHTHTHRLLFSILQEVKTVCVCGCVCTWVCVCRWLRESWMRVLRQFCSPAERSSSTYFLVRFCQGQQQWRQTTRQKIWLRH